MDTMFDDALREGERRDMRPLPCWFLGFVRDIQYLQDSSGKCRKLTLHHQIRLHSTITDTKTKRYHIANGIHKSVLPIDFIRSLKIETQLLNLVLIYNSFLYNPSHSFAKVKDL